MTTQATVSRGIKRALAPVLVAAMCLVAARAASAAGAALPPNAVLDDTFLVMRGNVSKLTAESVRASAKAILGDNTASIDEGLKDWQAKSEVFKAAGVTTVTAVISGKELKNKQPSPAVYFDAKDPSHDEDLKKLLTEKMSPADKEKAVFERSGDYLVMREKGAAADAKGTPSQERSTMFADALAGADDKAVAIVFAPSDDMKAQMLTELQANPQAAAILPILQGSKHLVIGVQLGEAPSVKVTAQAADADGAKQIATQLSQLSAQVKQMAAQLRGNPAAAMLDAVGEILTPTQEETRVSLNIDAKNAGPVISGVMQQMRGGGGPPKGGGL